MAQPELRSLLHHIHHLAGPCAAADLSDRDLLAPSPIAARRLPSPRWCNDMVRWS